MTLRDSGRRPHCRIMDSIIVPIPHPANCAFRLFSCGRRRYSSLAGWINWPFEKWRFRTTLLSISFYVYPRNVGLASRISMTNKFVFSGFALAVFVFSCQLALASPGCSQFRGLATDSTKGPGGERVGAKFNKGDRLIVKVHEGREKFGVNLQQYSSPDGPIRDLTDDASEDFAYTVPANTDDFIYLNFGGPFRGMIVIWGCTPAPIDGH